MSQIPVPFVVVPQLNAFNVNVDSSGNTILQVILGPSGIGGFDRNFELEIDWGDGIIDIFPGGSISSQSTFPNLTRLDSNGAVLQITHQYIGGNPNAADPTAAIPIQIALAFDPLGRIQIDDVVDTASQLNLNQTQLLSVPRRA